MMTISRRARSTRPAALAYVDLTGLGHCAGKDGDNRQGYRVAAAATRRSSFVIVCRLNPEREKTLHMTWDLKEPECLSQARLMVAPPAFVYEQMKFYGETVDAFWAGKQKLEEALLGRNDKLIDLALAQFATHEKVIQYIFNRANIETTDDEQARYNLGVRVACLSNRHLGFFNRPDFGLDALMAKGFTSEAEALLTNPGVQESILLSLYKKSDCFEQVTEEDWLAMIYSSASNERLNTKRDVGDSLDLDLRNIQKAIFGFLETAPVTKYSVHTARYFLWNLNPEHTAWPNEISHVLKRWGEVEVKNYKGEEEKGWLTHLSLKEELRCLIAALYSQRSTDVKDHPGYFGSPEDSDIALRCAFYAGHDLSKNDIKAGFERDSEVFVFAILKNQYALLNKEKRSLVEGYLSGRFMISEYRSRCEQLRKKWPGFDPSPVSEETRNILEEEHHQGSDNILLLEKIGAQNDRLAARLARLERRSYWVVVVLIVAMYFVRS